MPYPLQDAEADKIVNKFVNDRLIGLMENAILDMCPFLPFLNYKQDEDVKTKPFEEIVNIADLMTDRDYAETIAMEYLPENYPPQKASQEFFGLYRLLKAGKDYVPELPMEYILFRLIFNEVDDIDTINGYIEDGVFDGPDDGLFTEDIEDREYTTVMLIPEPERTIVKNAIRKSLKGQCAPEELEEEVEHSMNWFEDLREYEESCFWDTDFLFLDDMTEEELLGSELNEFLGIGVPKENKIIEFPVKGQDGGNVTVKAQMKVYPWDFEEDGPENFLK